jgi:positive regulator of sigma E activity
VPFVAGIIFVVVRLVQRPGNIGVVSQGFGERGNRFEEITWSSLQQEVTFGPASPTPLLDWNLLWRNFLEVPGLWLGVFGGYPWGSLGWLDTTLPQIVPLIVLTVIMAVATTALKDSNWRQITAVIGMFGILWFIPLYLLQIGGYKVGEEFQPRYLIPLVVVLVGVMVLRPTGAPQVLSSPKALALIAVSLGVANSIALHTNIRRYVTGLDIGGLDLNYAREWWWWFMPQFFTPNWLWVGGSLAFFGVTWIVVYYLPRQAALANALAQKS